MCVCVCEKVMWESVLLIVGMLPSDRFLLLFRRRFYAGGVLGCAARVCTSAWFCAGGVLGCARGVLMVRSRCAGVCWSA